MATNLPSCFSTEVLEQLMKFLVNFTLLKYGKSQRSYGFLITKELIFGFQILDLKNHFSASLTRFLTLRIPRVLEPHRIPRGGGGGGHHLMTPLMWEHETFVRYRFILECLIKGKVDQISFVLSFW